MSLKSLPSFHTRSNSLSPKLGLWLVVASRILLYSRISMYTHSHIPKMYNVFGNTWCRANIVALPWTFLLELLRFSTWSATPRPLFCWIFNAGLCYEYFMIFEAKSTRLSRFNIWIFLSPSVFFFKIQNFKPASICWLIYNYYILVRFDFLFLNWLKNNGLQELGFDYAATTPSDINHDVLFREGETQDVSSLC